MTITLQELLSNIKLVISHHSETPALDAQVLVAHFLDRPRSWVLAHPEAQIMEDQYKMILGGMNRLAVGEPLPYIIGHREFYGSDFQLTPDVLIPRPETELLVERAITWLRDHPNRRRAIDVGTGSGCVGISLALHIPDLYVLLTDISPSALKITRVNVEKFGLTDRLELLGVDLLDGISARYDLICANLPYIPSEILRELPVSKREPLLALDGGESGTELLVQLLDQSRGRLAPEGLMLLEIESSQGIEIKTMAERFFPTAQLKILKDLSGLDRCIEISLNRHILHLCQREEWQNALELGIYMDESISQDGFIHCSQPQQILEVANRFYRGIPGLVLLWIDPQKVTSEIHWEAADGELFPHIYGPINLDAVFAVTEFNPDDGGIFRSLRPSPINQNQAGFSLPGDGNE